jgi:hypothetical protein
MNDVANRARLNPVRKWFFVRAVAVIGRGTTTAEVILREFLRLKDLAAK